MRWSREHWAFVAPFGVFMLLLALISPWDGWFAGHRSLFLHSSRYWILPAQTFICGALLWWFWPSYQLKWPRHTLAVIALGFISIAVWVAPQEWLGFPARTKPGFDPGVFAADPRVYWLMLGLRFARLVVVVPLVEEIFWRGFLLRDLIDPRFTRVPLGVFSWYSFGGVTLLFGLAHYPADFVTALIFSATANAVMYWTKSLSSCVLLHAVTNLLLGLYVMRTGQWGFW